MKQILALAILLSTINTYAACGDSDPSSGINTLITDGCSANNSDDLSTIVTREIQIGEEVKSDSLNLKFQALQAKINALNAAPATGSLIASLEADNTNAISISQSTYDAANVWSHKEGVTPTVTYQQAGYSIDEQKTGETIEYYIDANATCTSPESHSDENSCLSNGCIWFTSNTACSSTMIFNQSNREGTLIDLINTQGIAKERQIFTAHQSRQTAEIYSRVFAPRTLFSDTGVQNPDYIFNDYGTRWNAQSNICSTSFSGAYSPADKWSCLNQGCFYRKSYNNSIYTCSNNAGFIYDNWGGSLVDLYNYWVQ